MRARLLFGVLQAAGELGYRNIAVRHILEEAQVSRGTFYRFFQDKADCFAEAHEATIERFARHILGTAASQPDWCSGLRCGLSEVLQAVGNEPIIFKALFIEPHAAGGRALEKREEVMDRFARAIDSAKNEATATEPPLMTGRFMVGAIEEMILSRVVCDKADALTDLLPGLIHFVVLPYFGEDVARAEMASAPLSSWILRPGGRVPAAAASSSDGSAGPELPAAPA